MRIPFRVPACDQALHFAPFVDRRVAGRQAHHRDRRERREETLIRNLLVGEAQPLPIRRQPGNADVRLEARVVDPHPVFDMRDGEAALQHQAVGDRGGDVEIGIALERCRIGDLLGSHQRNSEESEGILPADVAVGALAFDAIAQGDAAEIDIVRQTHEQSVVIVVEVLQQVEARTQFSVVVDVGVDVAVGNDRVHQVACAE